MLVRNRGLGTNRSGPTTHVYGRTAGALSKRLSPRHVRAVNLKLLVVPANPAQFHERPQRDTGWDLCTAGSFWPSTTCLPGEHSWGQRARIQRSSLSRYSADRHIEQEGTEQKTRQLSAVHLGSPTLLEMKLGGKQNVSKLREFAVLKFI